MERTPQALQSQHFLNFIMFINFIDLDHCIICKGFVRTISLVFRISDCLEFMNLEGLSRSPVCTYVSYGDLEKVQMYQTNVT